MTATEYVLALATLGDTTKNRNNPIFCRAAQEQCLLSLVAVAGVIALDFANVNTALQPSLIFVVKITSQPPRVGLTHKYKTRLKCLKGTNALAYFAGKSATKKKKFITITTRRTFACPRTTPGKNIINNLTHIG
jgi:hypothetical protein